MKKLALIGKGTAGCLSAIHFLKYTDWELDWYFDPNIKAQAVGEGSQLSLPTALYTNMGFEHHHLSHIDGTSKFGIMKFGWSPTGGTFIHTLAPPFSAFHFNANKLQDFIVDYARQIDRVNFKEFSVADVNDVDADYVMDCSGKPTENSFDKFHFSEYIPVNSVHVTQCYWDSARFNYTLTIARPYGWVFAIPLVNRCSIGYLYNKDITTLEDVKEDVKQVFEQLELQPSDHTNSFTFNNYYRKVNFDGRVARNGNASFFLEPLEATSIDFMNKINRHAFDLWAGNLHVGDLNYAYLQEITEIEQVIMLHYFAGSIYDNEFWTYATERGEACLRKAMESPVFRSVLDPDIDIHDPNSLRNFYAGIESNNYGTWAAKSFKQNLHGLKLYDKLYSLDIS
jgi:hypothetical protein